MSYATTEQRHRYGDKTLIPFFVIADLFHLDPRFEKKVEAESEAGCWFWTGGSQKSGQKKSNRYGRIWFRGKMHLVHRYVYWLFWGIIPVGMEVHHTCFKQLCVNPNHLVALTEEEHREEHEENLHRGYNALFTRSKLNQALKEILGIRTEHENHHRRLTWRR